MKAKVAKGESNTELARKYKEMYNRGETVVPECEEHKHLNRARLRYILVRDYDLFLWHNKAEKQWEIAPTSAQPPVWAT